MTKHKCSSPWCGECVTDSWGTPEAKTHFARIEASKIDCQKCGDRHPKGPCPKIISDAELSRIQATSY